MQEVPNTPFLLSKFYELYTGGDDFVCREHVLYPTIFTTFRSDTTPKYLERVRCNLDKMFIKCFGLCRKCCKKIKSNEIYHVGLHFLLGTNKRGIAFRFGYSSICAQCVALGNELFEQLPGMGSEEHKIIDQFVQDKWIEFVGTNPKEFNLGTIIPYITDDTIRLCGSVAKFLRICQCCDKIGASKRCSSCRIIRYCDSKCQKSHWDAHKKVCKLISTGKSIILKDNKIEC